MSLGDAKYGGTNVALILAGLPALALSAVVMHLAGAGVSLIALQLGVALVAATLCGVASWRGWRVAQPKQLVVAVLLLVLLVVPLLTTATSGPTRWINLPGVRLYAASLVLPALIFLLSEGLASSTRHRQVGLAVALGAGAVLAIQPDASQVAAFGLACAVAMVHLPFHTVQRFVLMLVLAGCNWYAWNQPDPLQPVAYVEGVLGVARAAGVGVLALAIAALALPVAVLVWCARTKRSVGLLSVAAYYVAIGVCAQQELTPMPLLGFGAGPILGFYLFCALSAGASSQDAAPTSATLPEG